MTVMHFDPEKHVLKLVAVNLEKAGYKVISCDDPKTFVSEVIAKKPDIVLTEVIDRRLNEANRLVGFMFLKSLGVNELTETIPVVALSMLAEPDEVKAGWDAGFDCYITKPFNPADVVRYITEITGPPT